MYVILNRFNHVLDICRKTIKDFYFYFHTNAFTEFSRRTFGKYTVTNNTEFSKSPKASEFFNVLEHWT